MEKRSNRNPWWVVAGAVLGLVVGNGPVMQFTFGVFVKPVTEALGVDRGTVSTALMVGLLFTALGTPIAGRLMDRHGIRKVALPAILLFAISMAAIGWFTTSPMAFICLYALAGLFAAGQTPLGYAKAITAAFDRRRGLALGVAMAGIGIGTALLPKFVLALVESVGWQKAYVGAGVLTAVLALPAMAWMVTSSGNTQVAKAGSAGQLPGLSSGEALRSAAFWKLAAAFFAVAVAANGIIAHIVPLLTDQGIDAGKATSILGVTGMALIAGRLLAGYMLDRVFGPYVTAVFFFLPFLGIALLLAAPDASLATPAIILIGLGLGAEVDLIAYLQSRYLGLKAFGEIYGYLFAIFVLGSGVGPFLMGMAYGRLGSYTPALYLLAGLLLAACVVALRLGSYRYNSASPGHASVDADPATT